MSFDPRQVYDAYKRDPNHDMNEYLDLLVQESRGTVMEIGVRWGVSTACFLLGAAQRVFSVDLNPRCAGHYANDKRWRFVEANSKDDRDDVRRTVLGPVDVLFIDGDHSYEGLTNDLVSYHDLVKKGGTILVHDVAPQHVPTPQEVAEGWPGAYTTAAWEDFLARFPVYKKAATVLPGKFGMGVIRL
jgi:predicted O-methyltransferase YrrM